MGTSLNRIVSPGLIYKVYRYSDNSAIGQCFFKEFGKLKLFIPKMYSNKGGVTKILPGDIDFLKKEHSDLNKFYGIRYDTSKMCFVENVDIFIRLNLIFNVFDILYTEGEPDVDLYNLIMHIDAKNMKRAAIYITSYILKNQGIFPNLRQCGNCGKLIETTVGLSHNEIVCNNCIRGDDLSLTPEQYRIFSNIFNSDIFKHIDPAAEDEYNILSFIARYTQRISGRKINGLDFLAVI